MYLTHALKVLLFCKERALDFLDAEISMLKYFRNICAFDLISCDLILTEVQHMKPLRDLDSFVCLYIFATSCC